MDYAGGYAHCRPGLIERQTMAVQTAHECRKEFFALLKEAGIQPGPEWIIAFLRCRIRELKRKQQCVSN